TEEIALPFGAAVRLQKVELFLGFDAFGNDALIEAFAHVDDGADNGGIVGVAADLVDEGLVDLEDINGKLAEIAETGIAGAKVVDGQVYTPAFDCLKYVGGGRDIVHQDALGDLQIQIAGIEAGLREY